MPRITYEIEQRSDVLAQIAASGQAIVEDVLIDLDANGRHTNCYFEVVDAPPPVINEYQAYYEGMTEVLDGE